jgi:hypothetical protein
MAFLLYLINFMNIFNFLFFSILFNYLCFVIIIGLTFFFIQIKKEIDSVLNAYDSVQFIMAERFTTLSNELLFLNSENIYLAKKLNAKMLNIESFILPGKLVSIDVNSTLIFIKIFSFLLLLSFLVYTLTNPFCHAGLLGKTFSLICKINADLIWLLGIHEIKQIDYRDSLGTDFLIRLSNDEKTVEIAIKTLDMLEFVSLTEYIQGFI